MRICQFHGAVTNEFEKYSPVLTDLMRIPSAVRAKISIRVCFFENNQKMIKKNVKKKRIPMVE